MLSNIHSVEACQRGIRHWESEINATRRQIAGGKYPEYDRNCRRYIRECRSQIRYLERRIHEIRQASEVCS